jgi:hypothetical protein
MEEQVALMRLLWTQPLVNFSGHWHTIPDAGINPLPVQRPIPVWFGGTDDKVLRRMARIGDGWMVNFRTFEQARSALDQLNQYLEEAGRDRASFGIEARLNMNQIGSDGWINFIHSWEELGATHLTVNTMGCGYETNADHIKALQKFAEMTGLS